MAIRIEIQRKTGFTDASIIFEKIEERVESRVISWKTQVEPTEPMQPQPELNQSFYDHPDLSPVENCTIALYLLNQSHAEIAEIIKAPKRSVTTNLTRARKKIGIEKSNNNDGDRIKFINALDKV